MCSACPSLPAQQAAGSIRMSFDASRHSERHRRPEGWALTVAFAPIILSRPNGSARLGSRSEPTSSGLVELRAGRALSLAHAESDQSRALDTLKAHGNHRPGRFRGGILDGGTLTFERELGALSEHHEVGPVVLLEGEAPARCGDEPRGDQGRFVERLGQRVDHGQSHRTVARCLDGDRGRQLVGTLTDLIFRGGGRLRWGFRRRGRF